MLTIENAGALIEGPPPQKGVNMPVVKIKLTRATVAGGEDRNKGWSGSVPEKEATYLFRLGKAVPCGKQDKKPADKKPADKKPADK